MLYNLLLIFLFQFSIAAFAIENNNMPAFSRTLASMQHFYKFKFLPDGYPGREDGWAHPIYGVYVLRDYNNQYIKKPTTELNYAIRKVANATINRMENFNGALVFWYEADPSKGARIYKKHYSGLTQGYYSETLYTSGKLLNDKKIIAAAEKAFKSLTIPVEEGGVLHKTPYGPVIAEVPQEPNSWILNGWQSALISVNNYATLSGSSAAKKLFLASSQAMLNTLPYYDIPDLKNSRYGLTGFAYLRITANTGRLKISEPKLIVPDEPSTLIQTEKGTRWQNYFYGDNFKVKDKQIHFDDNQMKLNVVLSFASQKNNKIEFIYEDTKPTTLTFELNVGEFSPTSASPVNLKWVELGKSHASPGQKVEFEVSNQQVNKVVYPTNFRKKIDNKNTNVYHVIHIKNFRNLATQSGKKDFNIWADKWYAYICDWSKMKEYNGYYVRDIREESHARLPSEFCKMPKI